MVRGQNAPALGGDLAGRHLQVSPNNEHLIFGLAQEDPTVNVGQGHQVGYGGTAHKFTGLHESCRHGREITIGNGFIVIVAGDALVLPFRVGGSFVRRLFLAVGCPVYEPGSG